MKLLSNMFHNIFHKTLFCAFCIKPNNLHSLASEVSLYYYYKKNSKCYT